MPHLLFSDPYATLPIFVQRQADPLSTLLATDNTGPLTAHTTESVLDEQISPHRVGQRDSYLVVFFPERDLSGAGTGPLAWASPDQGDLGLHVDIFFFFCTSPL